MKLVLIFSGIFFAGLTQAQVSSITGLRSLSGMVHGDQQSVAGYYMAADGGGGLFIYDNASIATDNGGTVIIPNSNPATGRWIRACEGPINVRWFGAKGDESSSATGAFNNSILAALAVNGGAPEVFVPAGDYLIASPGVLCGTTEGVTLVGEGREATRLNVQTGSSVDGLRWTSPSLYGRNGGLRNLTVWSPAVSSSRDLLRVENWSGWKCENVTLSVCGQACLRFIDSTFCSVDTALIRNSAISGVVVEAPSNSVSTTCLFTNCYVSGNGQVGADISGLALSFVSCIFESNGIGASAEGVRVRDGSATFVGCYWEDNEGDDLTSGYDVPAGWSNGCYVAVVNPFTQKGANRGSGKGGFKAIRGQLNIVGPGHWLGSPNKTVQVDTANHATVRLLGLPASLSPRPSYTNGDPLPSSAFGLPDTTGPGDRSFDIAATTPGSASLNLLPNGGGVAQIAAVDSDLLFLRNAMTRVRVKAVTINIAGLPVYPDNASAIAGGLVSGDLYRDGDLVKIVH